MSPVGIGPFLFAGDTQHEMKTHMNAHNDSPSSASRLSGSASGAYDVVVIGGGASGLAAAITAARMGARTAIVERDVACGLPILATGNGRCNLSNARLDSGRYRHPDAAARAMGPRPEDRLSSFLDSLGIMACEIEGRLYPVTRRAESVRDALLAAADRAGVRQLCGTDLVAARPGRGGRDGSSAPAWELSLRVPASRDRASLEAKARHGLRRARKALAAASLEEQTILARRVILAVGGASRHVCSIFGLPHIDEVPVLCPVACDLSGRGAGALAALDGIRVDAALVLARGGRALYREQGEVLFRPYGLSGIVAFNVSRRAQPGDALELDLFPQLETGSLMGALRHREDAVGEFDGTDERWFDGMLARPVARLVLELLAADPACPSDGMRGDLITRTAKLLKRLPFAVSGRADERQAQVRRGGIPLTADVIDLADMRLKQADGPDGPRASAPALYACGEALDQDADCGGYNLAWAWLTGLRAGSAAHAGA